MRARPAAWYGLTVAFAISAALASAFVLVVWRSGASDDEVSVTKLTGGEVQVGSEEQLVGSCAVASKGECHEIYLAVAGEAAERARCAEQQGAWSPTTCAAPPSLVGTCTTRRVFGDHRVTARDFVYAEGARTSAAEATRAAEARRWCEIGAPAKVWSAR